MEAKLLASSEGILEDSSILWEIKKSLIFKSRYLLFFLLFFWGVWNSLQAYWFESGLGQGTSFGLHRPGSSSIIRITWLSIWLFKGDKDFWIVLDLLLFLYYTQNEPRSLLLLLEHFLFTNKWEREWVRQRGRRRDMHA